MRPDLGVYKFLVLMTMVLSGGIGSYAQQTQFIYLQCEAEQPFYAELNGVQYTSSLTGYLAIHGLRSGDIHLLIGFPATGKEYVFDCSVASQSRAFSMKREVDNSWTLFDMVDFSETRGVVASLWREQQLARQKQAAKAAKELAKRTGTSGGILKIYDRPSPGGVDQVYVVSDGLKKDTIALFIPHLDEIKPRESGYLSVPAIPLKPAQADLSRAIVGPQRNRYITR